VSNVNNMRTFSFSCVCDIVEFNGMPLTVLAAPTQGHGCVEMEAVVFPD
jgi:hypothetical protein